MGVCDETARPSAAPIARWLRRLLVVAGLLVGAWLISSSLNTAAADTAHNQSAHDQGSPSDHSAAGRPVGSLVRRTLTGQSTQGARSLRAVRAQLTAHSAIVMTRVATEHVSPTVQGIIASAAASEQQLQASTIATLERAITDPAGAAKTIVIATPNRVMTARVSLATAGHINSTATSSAVPGNETVGGSLMAAERLQAIDDLVSTAGTPGLDRSSWTGWYPGANPGPLPEPSAPSVPDQQSGGTGGEAQLHDAGSAVLPYRLAGNGTPQPVRLNTYEHGDRRDRPTLPAVSPD